MTPPGVAGIRTFWAGLSTAGIEWAQEIDGSKREQSGLIVRLSGRTDGVLAAIWIATLTLISLGVNDSDPEAGVSAKFRLTGDRPVYLALGAALLCAAVLAVPWMNLRRDARALLFLASIVLLYPFQYHVLPWTHPHAVLVLLPVLCLAVRHRGQYLAVGLGLATFGLWVPVIDGHRTYMDVVDHGFVFVGLVVTTGATVHVLVERMRLQTRVIDALAHTDALTGLANRRGWDEQLPRMLAHAGRQSNVFSVGLIDLDLFKEFNDRLGHQAGDCLLREAARNWLSSVREQDLLARWGGDEFALALPNCTRTLAMRTIHRMAADTPLAQTFCCGVVEWDGEENVDNLLARADAELYAAKRAFSASRVGAVAHAAANGSALVKGTPAGANGARRPVETGVALDGRAQPG